MKTINLLRLRPMSQRDLARELGISDAHMTNILKRKRIPSKALAARLEKSTGIESAKWRDPDGHDNPFLQR